MTLDEGKVQVWIVIEGYYSDAGPVAVFSSEQGAVDYCKGLSEYNVQGPFDLDSPTYRPKKGVCVTMRLLTGDSTSTYVQVGSWDFDEHIYVDCEHRPDERSAWQLVCCTETEEPELAIKVLNEKRAMLLAQGDVYPGYYHRHTLKYNGESSPKFNDEE